MRFLTLAALALAAPTAGRADPRPIPAVPPGEAKPAGHQAPAPAPVVPLAPPGTLPPAAVLPGPVIPVPPPPIYVPVNPPVVLPATPAVVLPDGATRIVQVPLPDGTNRFGPGTTLAERLQYWQLVHSWAPDGTPKPVGAGNFYTEMKWIFGSARQFFGTAGATVGYGRGTREP
jgi:hypothetical protein